MPVPDPQSQPVRIPLSEREELEFFALAEKYGLLPGELAAEAIRDYMASEEEGATRRQEFDRIARHVLEKNAELSGRLADPWRDGAPKAGSTPRPPP